jgi:hypothetical protein
MRGWTSNCAIRTGELMAPTRILVPARLRAKTPSRTPSRGNSSPHGPQHWNPADHGCEIIGISRREPSEVRSSSFGPEKCKLELGLRTRPAVRPKRNRVLTALAFLLPFWLIRDSFSAAGIYASCKVIGRIPDRPLVILDAGRDQGVSLDDPAVLLADGQIAAAGRVFYLESNRCSVRLNEQGAGDRQANVAVVVPRSLPGVCRVALPPDTTIWADVDEVTPGHRTAWVNHGRDTGLRLGDRLLITRSRVAIARGDVIDVLQDSALIRFQTVAAGSFVRRGDKVRLWPSPAEGREGCLRVPVMTVEQEGPHQCIWLPGGTADGLVPDRQIEFFRGDTYVATATIDQAGESAARAVTMDACARQAVQAGDTAVLMIDSSLDQPRFAGRVFRIEGDYCLLSIGEDTGVRRGQVLYVVRDRQVVATVKIKTIKQGYCGAELERSESNAARKPQLWDQVLSSRPQQRLVQGLGHVTQLTDDGQFATVALPGEVKNAESGTIVSIIKNADTVGAAIIIHKSPTSMILHVPACWREAGVSLGANVRYVHDVATSEE